MGTPNFAVGILDRMLQDEHNIVGVITAVDKPAGRGRKLRESAVKKYAVNKGLPVLQPKNLKSPNFQKELKLLKANLQVVVAFRMLPKSVWNLPEYGTFNLHASLLPDYRGAAPIHWAIINGEEKTGVTTFFIDEKIDTGEMILKKEIVIREDETVGELHERLMVLGAQTVSETLSCIKNDSVSTTKQPLIELKSAPKLYPNNCKVNWNTSLNKIYNQIRGLDPFPAAWGEIENGNDVIAAKFYAIRKEKIHHKMATGSIIASKKEIKVAVNGGYIIIDELKLSGKKKMQASSLLNGYTLSSEAKMR